MYKLNLERAGELDQIANIHSITEKAREFQKNIYFCFTDYAKAFDSVDHNKLWKILQVMGIPEHFTCLLRNLYAGEVAQLEPDMKQWTVSKFRKMYVKALYCHPAYLTYMLSSSCEMLSWMKDRLESRLPGEIPTTSNLQMILF